jgi:hypothetical protein
VAPSVTLVRLGDLQQLLVGLAVGATGVLLWLRRADPVLGAGAIWLVAFAVNPNFSYTYLVWGLPFLIAAGWLRSAAALQFVLAIPAALLYRVVLTPSETSLEAVYVPLAVGAWIALVVWAGVVLARIARGDATTDAARIAMSGSSGAR